MRKVILPVLISILTTTWVAAEPAVIPMRLQRGFLVVFDCAISPLEKLACVLDTGASRTIVNVPIANRLHLQGTNDELFVAGRSTQVSRIQVQEITFGVAAVRSLPVLVLDLSGFSKAVGMAIDVVVGQDALCQHSVTIDYRRRVLRFDETITGGTSVWLDPDSPYPLLPVRIGDDTVRLLLDTGADAISLFEGHAPAHVRTASQVEVTGSSAAGAVRASAIRAVNIQIAGKNFGRHTIFVIPGETGFTAYDGHFGILALDPSWFHFDFRRRQICWAK